MLGFAPKDRAKQLKVVIPKSSEPVGFVEGHCVHGWQGLAGTRLKPLPQYLIVCAKRCNSLRRIGVVSPDDSSRRDEIETNPRTQREFGFSAPECWPQRNLPHRINMAAHDNPAYL